MTLKAFKDLQPGDVIMGTDNKPVTVARAYDEHLPETMYRLEMDNGEVIEASGNHLWYVESSLDRSLHRSRVKDARKILKHTDASLWEELETLAAYPDHAEIALQDLLELFEAYKKADLRRLLVRVAESLGPVAEENTDVEDIFTGEAVKKAPPVRLYDARLFSQQLLALKDKRWEKKWPIVRGQVMTTEQLSLIAATLHLPEVKSLR